MQPKCDCLDKMSEALAARNVGIDCPMQITMRTGQLHSGVPHLVTFKLDPQKRGRMPIVLCNYCPFCGARYERDDDSSEASDG